LVVKQASLSVQVLAAVAIAGCGLSERSGPPNPYIPEGEPDYRRAAQSARTLFIVPVDLAGAEISRPRLAHQGAPTDWMVCLKVVSGQRLRYHAMFLRGGEVVHHRAALPLDRCEDGVFEPLAPPTERPAEPKKSAR